MSRAAAIAAVAACVALAALLAPRPGRSYVDGPPPAHTGGFGEPTCGACHAGGAGNGTEGALELAVPARYAPGSEHLLEVRLVDASMRRAGFQLSARFAEGERAGRQAGELRAAEGGASEVSVAVAHEVAYAGHRAATERIDGGRAVWRVRWTAPAGADAASPVVFHAAANGADYDDSELGDRVFVAVAISRPVGRESRAGYPSSPSR